MLSLYLHLPFCRFKCEYCSFHVVPEEGTDAEHMRDLKERYTQQLCNEITFYKTLFPETGLRTIYIGGGTPLQLGKERLFTILETIFSQRDTEHLEELTIELNPDPMDEVLQFVQDMGKRYPQVYKLRFSFGIQSFDDTVLQAAKRGYTFDELVTFFRNLREVRQQHMSFNADFIAFGHEMQGSDDLPYVRGEEQRKFFYKLIHAHLMDGFSLYTLELFPGSERFNQQRTEMHTPGIWGDDEAIMREFHLLRHGITNAGYRRYELSNFSLLGKASIHNIVYRSMKSYLGLGISASSFLEQKFLTPQVRDHLHLETDEMKGVRFKNTHQRKPYLAGEWIDHASTTTLDERAFLTEQAFLAIRTSAGLRDVSTYADLFVSDRKDLLTQRHNAGFVYYDNDSLLLTTNGYDVYNTLITDLFQTL